MEALESEIQSHDGDQEELSEVSGNDNSYLSGNYLTELQQRQSNNMNMDHLAGAGEGKSLESE